MAIAKEDGLVIKDSLPGVRLATFCVMLPEPKRDGRLTPMGTGFFISADGLFVTARHVLGVTDGRSGTVRDDVNRITFVRPNGSKGGIRRIAGARLVFDDVDHDVAILKAKRVGKSGFPYLSVSRREANEGDLVYCFGYPHSDLFGPPTGMPRVTSVCSISVQNNWILVLKPKVASALVAAKSCPSRIRGVRKLGADYSIDRGIDFGMSGAPVILPETHRVIGVAVETEAVIVPQTHLHWPGCNCGPIKISVPGSFGIVASLAHANLISAMAKHGVSVHDD